MSNPAICMRSSDMAGVRIATTDAHPDPKTVGAPGSCSSGCVILSGAFVAGIDGIVAEPDPWVPVPYDADRHRGGAGPVGACAVRRGPRSVATAAGPASLAHGRDPSYLGRWGRRELVGRPTDRGEAHLRERHRHRRGAPSSRVDGDPEREPLGGVEVDLHAPNQGAR